MSIRSHRNGDSLNDLAVLLNSELVRVIVGKAFNSIPNGVGGVEIFLPVETIAEVMTIALDVNVDLGSRLPEVFAAPAYFSI